MLCIDTIRYHTPQLYSTYIQHDALVQRPHDAAAAWQNGERRCICLWSRHRAHIQPEWSMRMTHDVAKHERTRPHPGVCEGKVEGRCDQPGQDADFQSSCTNSTRESRFPAQAAGAGHCKDSNMLQCWNPPWRMAKKDSSSSMYSALVTCMWPPCTFLAAASMTLQYAWPSYEDTG